MKKFIIIFLLLCSTAFGADVVTMWGEAGDGTGGTTIPGVMGKVEFDALGSPSELHGPNGEPISAGNAELTFTGTASLAIADTTDIVVGMYCSLNDTGSHDGGLYRIDIITPDVAIRLETTALDGIGTISGSDLGAEYSIGGLGEITDNTQKFQLLLNLMGTFVTSDNNLDILLNQSFTIDQTIDIDNIGGDTTHRHKLIGKDADFIAETTQVEITTTTDLGAGGLINMADTSDWTEWHNFDFNAGGKDANKGGYCVLSQTNGSSDHLFVGCDFHGAEVSGCHYHGVEWTFIRCNFYLNGNHGMEVATSRGGDSSFKGCDFYDNDVDGFSGGGFFMAISGCLAWGNIGCGFKLDQFCDGTHIYDNTAFDNGADGFNIDDLADGCRIGNNSAYANIGVGYQLNGGAVQPISFFGNNHAQDNSAHYSEGTDNTFADFSSGNNISGAPAFVSEVVGVGFLRPSSSSPLIDAGVGGVGDTIGALCAEAGGGGGSQAGVVGVSWN